MESVDDVVVVALEIVVMLMTHHGSDDVAPGVRPKTVGAEAGEIRHTAQDCLELGRSLVGIIVIKLGLQHPQLRHTMFLFLVLLGGGGR